MPDPRLVSTSTSVTGRPDLLALVAASPVGPRFFFHDPLAGRTIAAIGRAAQITAKGPDRMISGSRRTLRRLSRISGGGAIAVGGFAFSDISSNAPEWRELPPFQFVIPELTWIAGEHGCRLIRVSRCSHRNALDQTVRRVLDAARDRAGTRSPAVFLHGLADPEAPLQWRRRVEAVTSLINAGILRKIVLSRTGLLRADGGVPVARIVAGLSATRPLCRTFWLAGEETSFFGSSPELLLSRRGEQINSMALAGTAPRGERETDDRKLGQGLLASKKDRHEHALVVEAVREALTPATRRLEIAPEPELLRLPEAQHLLTPVTGRLREPLTLLELAALLHPTPAVCGVPRDLAAAILAREETHRGWYTGGIGWLDSRGNGEIAVALRSALAEGDVLRLYAGAGIVAGSDPAAELAETETKLAALRIELERLRASRAA